MEPETPKTQTRPAQPTAPIAPISVSPAGNIMDVVAAPAQQPDFDAVAQEPAHDEPQDQAPEPTEPAKQNSPLPTLLTKEEQAANTQSAQAKMPTTKTPGIGLAIAATTIIVITLAVLAFLAYIKQA